METRIYKNELGTRNIQKPEQLNTKELWPMHEELIANAVDNRQ